LEAQRDIVHATKEAMVAQVAQNEAEAVLDQEDTDHAKHMQMCYTNIPS